jgi:CubicO group peptidase (beta-lactamase class C family)
MNRAMFLVACLVVVCGAETRVRLGLSNTGLFGMAPASQDQLDFPCSSNQSSRVACSTNGASSLGSRVSPARRIIDGPLAREVDSFLDRLSGFGYSGSCLVTKDGNILLQKGYGLANRSEHIPVTAETVFDIGSLAKQFTAAAILLLESRGKLKTSDTIAKYLPNAPADKKSITIHQLLTHTSGVQSNFDLYEVLSEGAALKRVLDLPLSFSPGTQWQYSNGGYVLLASIVQSASGTPFRDFQRENLFGPAGMKHTGFWGSKAPALAPKLFARGYDADREVCDPRNLASDTWYDLGGGEVLSNVVDLNRWMKALTSGSVLPPQLLKRMFTPIMPGKPTDAYKSSDYGYGWFIQKTLSGKRRIQHGGDSVGFGSQLTWFPEEGFLLVCLCNVRQDLYPLHIRADRVVPQILFREAYTMPPAFQPSQPMLRKKIVGRYQLSTGGYVVVRDRDHALEISADGQDAVNILDVVDAAMLQCRDEATERTRKVLEGVFRGDLTALKQASGGNPGFASAVKEEIEAVGRGKGNLKEAHVMGTCSAGYPAESLLTLVRLEYENGFALYQLKWKGGALLETSDQPSRFLSPVPLQAAHENALVGWRIREQKKLDVELVATGGAITALKIHNGSTWVEAKRR